MYDIQGKNYAEVSKNLGDRSKSNFVEPLK